MLHINRYPVWPDGARKKQSNSFGPFTWPLRENYDARYVIDPVSLANDPDYGVPDFLWKRGDGNGCTVGPPGFAFTLTGAPTLDGVTPFQTPDGVALVGEKHTGASHRSTNAFRIDPADRTNHDQVVAVSFIEPYAVSFPPAAANLLLFSTQTSAGTNGWSLFYNTASYSWVMDGATFIGRTGFATGLSNCAITVVALLPAVGGVGWSTAELFCGMVAANTMLIGAPAVSGGVSLGSYVNGTLPMGSGGQILWAATWSGLGIAATWKAGSNKLLKRLAIESAGLRETAATPRKLWSYGTSVSVDFPFGTYYDRDGNLWPVGKILPAAGDSGGLRHFSLRANYTPNNCCPLATTSWTATGGAVLSVVADVAALTGVKIQRTGTSVFQVVNATGVDQYVWASLAGAVGDIPKVACCLSVFARYGAGAGARLGWWDRSASTFTDVGAVSDGYVRTVLNNTTPPDTDCRFCLKIPDGCTLLFTLTQAEVGVVASSPIINHNINPVAMPETMSLTEYTPAATDVGIVLEAAPLGYSGVAMGADNQILDRVTVGADILHMEAAAPGWATSDSTTQISAGSPVNGVYDFLWTAWRTVGIVLNQYIRAGLTTVIGAFDGTKGGAGLLRTRATVAAHAVKYIQIRYP